MLTLAIIVSVLINTVLAAWTVRRLMGVPVGWPRTFLLSFVAALISNPILVTVLEHAGVTDPTSPEQAGLAAAVAVLFVAWVIAIEISFLVVAEVLVPTGSVPGPVDWVRGLPAGARRTRRFTRIFTIALRHGLIRYLTRSRPSPREPNPRDAAVALREALTDGGVTFIKLGQMLATRPDLLPPRYIEELSKLHSQVPPESWESVRATLTEELGQDPEQIFDSIDHTPLAAASLGQVHRATLPGDRSVVVKVQRASARATVRADLDIITRLARMTEHRAEWARQLGTVELAEGFHRSLEEELDYRTELHNLTALHGAEGVTVPRAYPSFSTRRALTMDFIAGVPLSRARAELDELSPARRGELADTVVEVVLRQVLVDGVFHADLHGGNILLTPGGNLALLDFGSVGRLDRRARQALMSLLLAVHREDGAAAVTALRHLLVAPPDLDLATMEWRIGALIMRIDGMPADELFSELFQTVVRAGFQVPPHIAAAFRSLGALEGTLTLLHPECDVIAAARKVAGRISREQAGPRAALESGVEQVALTTPMAERLPAQLSSIVERLDRDNLGLNFSPLRDADSRAVLDHFGQLLSLAVLTAVAAFCGVALVLSEQGPHWADSLQLTTYIGLVLLLIAYVLGSRLAVMALRRGFTSRN